MSIRFLAPDPSDDRPFVLTDEDYPLYVDGRAVYRRTLSSPLFTVASVELAAQIAESLNRDRGLRGLNRAVNSATVNRRASG